MENKPEQLQFKFMEDILKEEQRKEFRCARRPYSTKQILSMDAEWQRD